MVRSPRPFEGRARDYGYQGSLSDGRLGPRSGGLNYLNFLAVAMRVKVTCNCTNRGVHSVRIVVQQCIFI